MALGEDGVSVVAAVIAGVPVGGVTRRDALRVVLLRVEVIQVHGAEVIRVRGLQHHVQHAAPQEAQVLVRVRLLARSRLPPIAPELHQPRQRETRQRHGVSSDK